MVQEAPFSQKRIKDVSSARTIYKRFRSNGEKRRQNVAAVLNQLNGGKPMSDTELVKNGQGWRCNINFRDAASTFEQVLVAYWRILHDTTNLINVTAHSKDPQAEMKAAAIQKNFNRFVEDWSDGYVRNYLHFAANHLGFGVGTVIWNNPKSPRFEVVRVTDIDVPERAKADTQSLNLVSIKQEMEVSDLWEKIRTPELKDAAKKDGWDVQTLQRVLWEATQGNQRPDNDDYTKVEDQIRNNDLEVSCTSSTIEIATFFVKEWDGKISTYIFAPKHETEGYLFDDSFKENRPSSMQRKILNVFFEAGNGLFWGSKGFGQKNFQIAAIQNRLKSRAVDRTLLDGLNFKDLSDGALSGFPVVNAGPFNLLPREIEQVQSYPSGSTTLDTIAMIDNQTSYNNARYRDQSRQVAQSQTATQANILANLQSQVDVANATLYLKQVTAIFNECLRRLRDPANKSDPDVANFFKRCEEDGADETFVHETEFTVTAGADPGAANIAVQGEYAKEIMQLSGDPDFDTRWAKERFVTARFGASAVSKALRPVDASGDIAARRAAVMENSDMGEGQALEVDPKDKHAAHLPMHLQPLLVITDRYNSTGQISPDAIIALQNLIPHIEAHFEYLKLDKTQDALRAQLWPEYTKARSTAEGIFRQLERAQAQAEMGGGPQPGMIDPAARVGATAPQ